MYLKLTFLFLLFCSNSCTHLFYQPMKDVLYPPEKLGLKPEAVTLTTREGLRISAWHFRPVSPSNKVLGTVLFFHGNAENMTSHYLNLVWMIHHGFSFIIFDYRGYGLSEGSPDPQVINEDAQIVLNWALTEHKKNGGEKFIVYGQSLGGIISARALADFKHKDEVDLLVQDSTFSSYQEIAQAIIKKNWVLFPSYPLTFFAISDEFSSKRTNSGLKIPVLCIHGDLDQVIPLKEGKKNFDTFLGPKWWWEIKNGKHGETFYFPDRSYREKFLSFVKSL